MKPPVAAVPADPTTVAARLAGHDRRPVLGVAFVLLAVWFRYLFQALGMTLVVLPMRGRRTLRTRHPWLHVLRGLLMWSSSLLSFLGLKYMPVAQITAIYLLAPLTATLLAVLFLGERVNRLHWLLVAGSLAGALLAIGPGDGGFGWAAWLPFCGMLIYAVFQVLTSRMTRTENPMVTHMLSGWVGMAVATALLPWVWQAIPGVHIWGLLSLAGVMGTVGHFLLIRAYTQASTATLAPCMYVQIAVAMLAGWIVFGQVPAGIDFLGMGLIMACGMGAAGLPAFWASGRQASNGAACGLTFTGYPQASSGPVGTSPGVWRTGGVLTPLTAIRRRSPRRRPSGSGRCPRSRRPACGAGCARGCR